MSDERERVQKFVDEFRSAKRSQKDLVSMLIAYGNERVADARRTALTPAVERVLRAAEAFYDCTDRSGEGVDAAVRAWRELKASQK